MQMRLRITNFGKAGTGASAICAPMIRNDQPRGRLRIGCGFCEKVFAKRSCPNKAMARDEVSAKSDFALPLTGRYYVRLPGAGCRSLNTV